MNVEARGQLWGQFLRNISTPLLLRPVLSLGPGAYPLAYTCSSSGIPRSQDLCLCLSNTQVASKPPHLAFHVGAWRYDWASCVCKAGTLPRCLPNPNPFVFSHFSILLLLYFLKYTTNSEFPNNSVHNTKMLQTFTRSFIIFIPPWSCLNLPSLSSAKFGNYLVIIF